MRSTAIALALALALPLAAPASEPMSRELKLPLAHAPFEKGDIEEAIKAYAQSFAALVKQTQGVEIAARAKLDKDRQVRFLDTPGSCALRAGNFILREREARRDYRLTLKTRSDDEAWVRATRIDAPDAKAKLEEDVVPPANGKLSRSATLRLVPRQAPATLAEAAALFPALKGIAAKDEKLAVVGNLKPREIVYELPTWKTAGTEFEPDLTVWRDEKDGRLLFVEAAFGYEVPKDPAQAQEAKAKAEALFKAMQADAAWVGPKGQSKTDFIYEGSGGKFCR